jgi:hypothetical protein
VRLTPSYSHGRRPHQAGDAIQSFWNRLLRLSCRDGKTALVSSALSLRAHAAEAAGRRAYDVICLR